jgi:tetratricopeptide (TPR) repeat protein
MAVAEPIAAKDVAPKEASDAPKPELVEAEAAFKKGDVEATLKALRQAAAKYPELPPAQLVLAYLYRSSGQNPNARAALQQAVNEVPTDPEPLLQSAEMDMAEGASIEASLLLEKALALTKDSKIAPKRLENIKSRVYIGLASLAEAQKDWPKAQKLLETLLAEQPKNTGALQRLGQAFFRQKKIDEAKAKFQAAAETNEAALNAEAMIAQLYHQEKDEKNAGQWMLDAIKAHPKDMQTRLVAADWSYTIGKLDQAETQAEAALKLAPDSIDAMVVRGIVALAKKDYPTAQRVFEKANAKSPNSPRIVGNLALALVEQTDDAKKKLALEHAQTNARQHPDQAEAAAILGWVLYRNGQLDEAEASLRRVMSSQRLSPDWVYFVAQVMADRGKKDAALSLLNSPIMKSTVPYLMRAEANALREQLSK